MNIYSTRLVLTHGIKTMDESEIHKLNGRDWHWTMEAAKLRAEHLRKQKIRSLLRQIARLESLKF